MEIISTVIELQKFLKNAKASDRTIGFVPTMGALHKGHISLVETANERCDITVVSIFVNPTQFNDNEDFIRYPVTIEADKVLLKAASCDVLFLPAREEVYPGGVQNMPTYQFDKLETILEGAFRPGHFSGVGQVVARLLDIVEPDVLFLGQKDYQQCIVIQQLIEKLGKANTIEVVTCSTVREADGLAMSSRNRRLTEPQRAIAGIIYQCLISVKSKQSHEKFELIKKECLDLLTHKGFEPEYLLLADAVTFEEMDDFKPGNQMIVLIAVRLGGVRLIDNMFI